jgi:hypothetical protein
MFLTIHVTLQECNVDTEQANGRGLASRTKSSPGAFVLYSHLMYVARTDKFVQLRRDLYLHRWIDGLCSFSGWPDMLRRRGDSSREMSAVEVCIGNGLGGVEASML